MRYLYSGCESIDNEYNAIITHCTALECGNAQHAFVDVFTAMESDNSESKPSVLKMIGGAIEDAFKKILAAIQAFLKGLVNFGRWVLGLFGRIGKLFIHKDRKAAAAKLADDASKITSMAIKEMGVADPDVDKVKTAAEQSISLYSKVIEKIPTGNSHGHSSNHQGAQRAKALTSGAVAPGRTGQTVKATSNALTPKAGDDDNKIRKEISKNRAEDTAIKKTVFASGNHAMVANGKVDSDNNMLLVEINKAEVGQVLNKLKTNAENLEKTIERNKSKLESANVTPDEQKKANATIKLSAEALRVNKEAETANVSALKAASAITGNHGGANRAAKLKGKDGKRARAKYEATQENLSEGEYVLYELTGVTPAMTDYVLESIMENLGLSEDGSMGGLTDMEIGEKYLGY